MSRRRANSTSTTSPMVAFYRALNDGSPPPVEDADGTLPPSGSTNGRTAVRSPITHREQERKREDEDEAGKRSVETHTPRKGMVFDSTEKNAAKIYRDLVIYLMDKVSKTIHVHPPITRYGLTIFPLGGDVKANAEEIRKIACRSTDEGGLGENWEFEEHAVGVVIPSVDGPEGLTQEMPHCPVLKRYAKSVHPLAMKGTKWAYFFNAIVVFFCIVSVLVIVALWIPRSYTIVGL